MSCKRVVVPLCLLVAAAGCSGPPTGDYADTVYTDGRIYTANPSQPWAEAVAITDGKFVKVGSNEDVEPFIGEDTYVIGLHGRMAMPGIIDLNVHPFTTALFNRINLEFSDPTSPRRMMAELGAFAEANPGVEWIRGGPWGIGVFPGNSPSRRTLDRVVRDRPVVLIDEMRDAYWLNSKALELAGINTESPKDTLSLVDRDPNTGRPTGVVRGSVRALVERAASQPNAAEYSRAFADVFREFSAVGVTAMQTAEGNELWMDVVRSMERDGDLKMRLFVGWDWHLHHATSYTRIQTDTQIANRSTYASDMVNPNFVNIRLDDTPWGYAVPLLRPYADGSEERGSGRMTRQELREIVTRFDADGVGTFMHAMGDASARAALDAIAAARKTNGDTGVRHKIGHVSWVHAKDIPRFAGIPGVAADISPAVTYPCALNQSYIPYVGEDRYRSLYPARSLVDAGARLGYGSDWLTVIPPGPWMPMQGFVTRRNPELPDSVGELGENQTLSVDQVIRMFTINGAWTVGAEDRIGSIEEGKLADMIVIDQNLFEIDPSRIRDTQILLTILGGRVIYARDRDG